MRGPHTHATFVLERTATFGRTAAADIQILDQRVSRQHARITVEASGNVVLLDLSSCNGTYVHGSRVKSRQLAPGDRIQIGFAEYVFEHIRDAVPSGHVFADKLTHRSTLGATIVRKPATADPDRGTVELPRARGAVPFEIPPLSAPRTIPVSPPVTLPPVTLPAVALPPVAPPPVAPPVSHGIEPPPPPIPGLQIGPEPQDPQAPAGWSDGTGRTLPFAPRSPDFFGGEADRTADETQPLSILEESPSATIGRAPAPTGALSMPPELARQAVDTVMRLLALRWQEASGKMLTVQDRMRLRKLEKALRESKRGGEDRRRWARLPCHLGVSLDLGARRGMVTDIGAGGLCIHDSGMLPAEGEELTVTIRLGDERLTRIAIFETVVAWVDSTSGSFGAVFNGPGRWEMLE